MLAIHTQPDEKNNRADFVIGLARFVRARLQFGMTEQDVRADLVPTRATEEEFFLALAAAKVLA